LRSFIGDRLSVGVSLVKVAASYNRIVADSEAMTIAVSTLRSWLARQKEAGTARTLVRPTRKSGNNDPDSLWAKASLAQAIQFVRQFEDGTLTSDAVVFVDEKRCCKVGFIAKSDCHSINHISLHHWQRAIGTPNDLERRL
jgi:hypothetical protein